MYTYMLEYWIRNLRTRFNELESRLSLARYSRKLKSAHQKLWAVVQHIFNTDIQVLLYSSTLSNVCIN